jgi:hypothetical protein
VNLVHELPAEAQEEQEESAPLWPDAESLAGLWRGEDTVLHGRLLSELKQAGITYGSRPTREAAGCGIDPVARGVEPRFGFIVRVQPKDSAAALEILHKLLEAGKVDFSIPVDTSNAYQGSQSRVESRSVTFAEANDDEAQQRKCVWEGNDQAKRDFVRASLRENGVPSDSLMEGRNYRIFVREAVQPKAVETIKEIVEGKPPSFEPDAGEASDKASWLKYQLFLYSIATALIVYVGLMILLTLVTRNPLAAQIPAFLAACAVPGAVWLVYQAVRYEKRPGLYLLMAIVPFSFIWYYFGRFKTRTSEPARPSFGQPPA